jgi:hypothetical protein
MVSSSHLLDDGNFHLHVAVADAAVMIADDRKFRRYRAMLPRPAETIDIKTGVPPNHLKVNVTQSRASE